MIDRNNKALMSFLYEEPADAFAKFGSEELVRKVAQLMEAGTSPEVFDQLSTGLADALGAYAMAALDLDQYRPENIENAALARVARKASDLHEAMMTMMTMMTMMETGRSERKLATAIDAFDKFPGGSSPAVLRGLVPVKRPFSASMLSDMISDLSVAAEQAINRKPEQDPDFAGGVWDDRQEQRVQTWRERSAAHKLPKDHALQELIASFRGVWLGLSSRPFTEGMHHADSGTTISRAVDALELLSAVIDHEIDRAKIVTAMRKQRQKLKVAAGAS
jgi:hypothetical protein